MKGVAVFRTAWIGFAFLLEVGLCLADQFRSAERPHAAILASGDKKAEAVVALVEAKLSARDEVAVLDRAQIEKVLREHDFKGKGLFSEKDGFRAGMLMGCDVFVDVHLKQVDIGGERVETIDLRALDGLTGARLVDVPVSADLSLDERVNRICLSVISAVQKRDSLKTGKTKSLSVNSVRDVGLPPSLRYVPQLLPSLLERYLLLSPEISVLDRERLGWINQEAEIARDTRDQLMASAIVVDLDVSRTQGGALRIRAALSKGDGSEAGAVQVEGAVESHIALMMELAGKIAGKLKIVRIEAPPDLLSEEADRYYRSGAFNIAVALAEGALALDRTNAMKQYNVALYQSRVLLDFANFNSSARSWPQIKEIPTGVFLSKLERCIDVLELGEKDGIPRQPRGVFPRAGVVARAMKLTAQQVPDGPGDVVRLNDARRRLLAWHRKTRIHNGNVIDTYMLEAACEDANAFLSENLALSRDLGVKLEPHAAFSLFNMTTLKDARRGARSFGNGVAPYQDFTEEGLSDENKVKLMALYESWARDCADRGQALEMHFACMTWASINRDIFRNHEEIIRKHLEAAKGLVKADPGLVSGFGRLVDGTPWGERVPAVGFVIPPAVLVEALRELLPLMRENKVACPDLLVQLDWHDPAGATYPGMYLDEAIAQLVDSKYRMVPVVLRPRWGEGPGAWMGTRKNCVASLKAMRVARYGACNELGEVAQVELDEEPLFVLPGIAAERGNDRSPSKAALLSLGMTNLQNEIVAAATDGSGVYIAVADKAGRSIGIIRCDLGSKSASPLGRIGGVAWGGITGMMIGRQNVYLYTQQGLLVFPLKGGKGWILDEKSGLPANEVGACCEVGDTLYIFCDRRVVYTTARRESYLVKCSPDGANMELLAASTRREKKSPLDNINKFAISSMLDDQENKRLLFTVTSIGLRGLWAYEYNTGAIRQLPLNVYGPHLLGTNAAGEFVLQGLGGAEWLAWRPGGAPRPLMSTLTDKPPRFMEPGTGDFPPGFPLFDDILVRPWTLAKMTKMELKYETELTRLDQCAPFFVARHKDKLVACTSGGLYLVDARTLRAAVDATAGPVAQVDPGDACDLTIAAEAGGILSFDDKKYKMWPGRPLHWGSVKAGRHKISVDWCGRKWGGDFDLKAGEKRRVDAFPDEKGRKVLVLDLGKGVDMKFVWIPPGEITVGDGGNGGARARRKVAAAKGFWMGQYEVTVNQFQRVMMPDKPVFNGEEYPVAGVSWDRARVFSDAFQKRCAEQLKGKTARLPWADEWEYACRGGTVTRFYFGDSDDYRDLAASREIVPVGRRMPNLFWLYDMDGNAGEWCTNPNKAGMMASTYFSRMPRAAFGNDVGGIRLMLEE